MIMMLMMLMMLTMMMMMRMRMMMMMRLIESCMLYLIVYSGKVTSAIKKLMPEDATGPWRVLCDNESFLRAPCSQVAHKKQKINLWKIPARSPDFNPIEKFGAWLRKVLRHRDLADL